MELIDRIKAMGVPADVAPGDELHTTVMVYDVDQLRELFDTGADQAARQAHADALLGGVAAGADGDTRLVHKVERYVVGNEELSEADRSAVAAVFPVAVKVIAAPGPKTINYAWDVSTPDGSPAIVDLTDFTIEQGGCVVCRSTPLKFSCNTLTRTGDSGSTLADFNILGTTGVTPPTPPQPGAATQAAKGKDGECSSVGVAGTGGQIGTPGAPGTPGTPGSPGGPGKPSQQATITISQTLTAQQLTVFTQSGPGGTGGTGGQGGQGQQGGNGGNGVTCDCTGNGGGPGANGGVGGAGGAAGSGGNGVDAAGNIVVKVPHQADIAKVSHTAAPAPPGAPGTPGGGGPGGGGGAGGSAGKQNSAGGSGGTGGPGATGAQGSWGTITGKPAQVTVIVG